MNARFFRHSPAFGTTPQAKVMQAYAMITEQISEETQVKELPTQTTCSTDIQMLDSLTIKIKASEDQLAQQRGEHCPDVSTNICERRL
ncbi:hypothetical protein O3P69_007152, partial [Scylla paramamosain]